MRIFIDTSAFFAYLDADDGHHERAKRAWTDLITSEAGLFCNNYVIVETFALLQNRLGMEAVRVFDEDILPLINVEWVNLSEHKAAVSALFAASRKKLSFVDCASFETMRHLKLDSVLTFDKHFEEQGFKCIPNSW